MAAKDTIDFLFHPLPTHPCTQLAMKYLGLPNTKKRESSWNWLWCLPEVLALGKWILEVKDPQMARIFEAKKKREKRLGLSGRVPSHFCSPLPRMPAGCGWSFLPGLLEGHPLGLSEHRGGICVLIPADSGLWDQDRSGFESQLFCSVKPGPTSSPCSMGSRGACSCGLQVK